MFVPGTRFTLGRIGMKVLYFSSLFLILINNIEYSNYYATVAFINIILFQHLSMEFGMSKLF